MDVPVASKNQEELSIQTEDHYNRILAPMSETTMTMCSAYRDLELKLTIFVFVLGLLLTLFLFLAGCRLDVSRVGSQGLY